MELAPFLTGLAARVVPGCDPDAVRRVFSVASAGLAGARRQDGQRVSWLTPAGLPFEASVVGGDGQPDAAVRYVTEAGTAVPFFAARLAAQRAALDELVGWLPESARSAAGELPRFVDTLFPDPAGVPARTLFATSVGVMHREDQPQHLARLKVYGNVGVEPSSVARLASVWPAYGEMAARLEPGPDLRQHFAALEIDGPGDLAFKLYFGCRRTDAGGVRQLASRFGFDLALDDIRDGAWERPFVICCGSSGHLSLHLPVKALEPDPGRRSDHVSQLAERHHGTTALVDALAASSAGRDQAWQHTIVGFGFAPDGKVARLNVYYAPA